MKIIDRDAVLSKLENQRDFANQWDAVVFFLRLVAFGVFYIGDAIYTVAGEIKALRQGEQHESIFR